MTFTANGKYYPCFSILFMLSVNKPYQNRKVSLNIHCKYKYFGSTVQRAEDRRQKIYFCHLPFAINVKLNLSNVILYAGGFLTEEPEQIRFFSIKQKQTNTHIYKRKHTRAL